MANEKPNTPASKPTTPPAATPPAFSLDFTDEAALPSAAEINAVTNPFQAKVNELARTGRKASVILQDAPIGDDGKPVSAEGNVQWAREQIRKACGNIGKGAKTKVFPLTEKPGYSKVFFEVGDKVDRPRKTGK